MLDLHRLNVLHQFSVTGSITATAAELGFSPSAISQQLATLERETGVALLERSAKRAVLTDAGRVLAEHAVAVLGAAERAESEMAAKARRVAGSVTVSTIPSLAATVAGILAELQQSYPGVEIRMRETSSSSAPVEILDRHVDLALVDEWRETPSVQLGLVSTAVAHEAVVVALPAPVNLRSCAVIATDELARVTQSHAWLCAPPGQPSRLAGDLMLERAGIHPPRRWEFEGLATIASLVALGSGAAILPESVVQAAQLEPSSWRRLDPPMSRRLHVLTRASASSSPTLRLLLACLERRLGTGYG